MDIKELQDYRLSDAIKFHNRLNPKIWGRDEHLLPEVREKLMAIAQDFKEFLGLDLEVVDITLSGSNAAYTYSDHSDVDLHLVADLPKADASDVYRELFDAKKYQYNDQHNYKIGGYDVELYVQNANEPPNSQGIYSVLNNEWIKVPARRKATVNDESVRSKYEDIGQRIDAAIKSGDSARLEAISNKVREMRQAGLDTTGEFGPENLAFKILRSNGTLDRLRQARLAARDRELSVDETVKQPVKYGYRNEDWHPNAEPPGAESKPEMPAGTVLVDVSDTYDWYKLGQDISDLENADPKMYGQGAPQTILSFGSEDLEHQYIKKLERLGLKTHDIDPKGKIKDRETDYKVNESADVATQLDRFVKFCSGRLGIKTVPRIQLKRDPAWSERNKTFGRYIPDTNTLILSIANRHPVDVMRTLAHELVHRQQEETEPMPLGAGDTGSDWENEANAQAGVIMRDFAELHPEYFGQQVVAEDSFNDNFNQIDSIITKKYPKEIMNLLLGMFPTAKEAIVTQYNDEDGMPFSEWRRAIYDIGNYVLSGPVVVNGSKLPIDPETEADRLAKYQQYIKDKDSGKPARYFRNNDADPRTIDFTKLPPITLAQTDAGTAVTDGNHRAFLAKMANKPLRAYVWKRQTNNHPNVEKIKALFSNQRGVGEALVHRGYTQGTDPNDIWNVRDDNSRRLRHRRNEVVLAQAAPKIEQRAKVAYQPTTTDGSGQRYRPEAGSHYAYIQGRMTRGLPQGLETGRPLKFDGRKFMYADSGEIFAGADYVHFTSDRRVIAYNSAKPIPVAGPEVSVGVTEGMAESVQQVVAEASGYIPVNKKEAKDPRYSMALTVDIRPGENQRQAAKMGWKTDPAGTPPTARTNGLIEALTAKLQAVKEDKDQVPPTKWQDIWQLNGQISTDQWCQLIENYHLGKSVLKESVDESIVKKIDSLIDNFSSDTIVGQRYIPVFVVGINNRISYYDAMGNSPAVKPAEFLTLVQIKNGQLTFEDKNKKQFTYPDRRLSGISYSAVIALDSIEKYNKLRSWLKLKDGVDLPAPATKSINEQEQEIEEVAMSPSALRAFAASPAAQGMMAGFEAELIFSGIGDEGEAEPEWEPDYEMDERAYDIEGIIDFFQSGDFAELGPRAADRIRNQMYTDYQEWLDEKMRDDWENDKDVAIREYLEVREYLEGEELKQRVEAALEEENDDYDNAREVFEEDWQNTHENDESDWLRSIGIRYMTDANNTYDDLMWPHYTDVNQGSGGDGEFSEASAQRLADDLTDTLDVETTVSSGYHSATRDAKSWIFEPDGSLSGDEPGDMPVEIVSPPMPLAQALEIMPKFFAWAESNGAYANKSTGFHMSVSMPEHEGNFLDYTKLALFLGDEYVLKQFGREANTYAKSAISKIRDTMSTQLKESETRAENVLSAMRKHLGHFASRALAQPSGFGKYTSINPKNNYIEFRSAGGSDYFRDIDKIQNTLMRYARAVDIAMDPDAEKSEYARKLYKLLTKTETEQVTDPRTGTTRTQVKPSGDNDAINIFSRYVAGELPKSALKSFLKQIQYSREVSKNPPTEKIQWRVTHPNGTSSIIFQASSKEEAIRLAKQEWNDRMNPDDAYRAEPYIPATQTPQTDQGEITVGNIPVNNPRGEFVIRRREGTAGTGPVLFRFDADNNREAIEIARRWSTARGIERGTVWLDHVSGLEPEELAPRTVQATLGEPRPAFQEPPASWDGGPPAGNQFSGEWRVVDGLGREVHRFGGIGNSQADANRVARQWAQQTGFDGNLEVYPVMR